MKRLITFIIIVCAVLAFCAKYPAFFAGTDFAGYHHDFTASTVYGSDTPVSFTKSFIYIWLGNSAGKIAKTEKWYTADPAEKWTVYDVEICTGIDCDDTWLNIEIGF